MLSSAEGVVGDSVRRERRRAGVVPRGTRLRVSFGLEGRCRRGARAGRCQAGDGALQVFTREARVRIVRFTAGGALRLHGCEVQHFEVAPADAFPRRCPCQAEAIEGGVDFHSMNVAVLITPKFTWIAMHIGVDGTHVSGARG